MTLEANDNLDPLVFEKILATVEAKLKEMSQSQRLRAGQKLTVELFVRVLLFRIFAQIKSLRTLRVDLASHPAAAALKLPRVGLSTLHDGFARYQVTWFASLSQHLATTLELGQIAEVAALGFCGVWTPRSGRW